MDKKVYYKSYSTRKFRSDHHYRLRLLAAKFNCTIEDILNDVIEAGLGVVERLGRGEGSNVDGE